MAAEPPDFKALIRSLPRRPGVYRMYDAGDVLIYVGKAARLRTRVASYFSSRPQPAKVAAMVRRVARIEVTVVGSETEALLLECNLIKAHRPRYNVILRDDKSYPDILCPDGHAFPRLMYWRGPRRPAGRRFGPFPNAWAARETLQRQAGLAAVALWEKQHGRFTTEEMKEARRRVRAQLRTSRTARRPA